jgi:malate synthase
LATGIFDDLMPGPNQLHRLREDVRVTAADLLQVPQGKITEAGLRANVSIGIQYLEAWLRGTGCVPLYHLMEDAATAEISRAQVWQWIRHDGGVLEDGRKVTSALVRDLIPEELKKIQEEIGQDRFAAGKFHLAAELFERLVTSAEFSDFLTLLAYPHL